MGSSPRGPLTGGYHTHAASPQKAPPTNTQGNATARQQPPRLAGNHPAAPHAASSIPLRTQAKDGKFQEFPRKSVKLLQENLEKQTAHCLQSELKEPARVLTGVKWVFILFLAWTAEGDAASSVGWEEGLRMPLHPRSAHVARKEPVAVSGTRSPSGSARPGVTSSAPAPASSSSEARLPGLPTRLSLYSEQPLHEPVRCVFN